MSNISINSNMPCYHLDLSAKTATFGTYDYATLLAQQTQMAEAERSNPQIGTATLTDQEIQDLAAKYDPSNMTNAEYNSFVNDLLNKGVLGRSETYGIYSDRVVLRPGHLSEGGISSSPVRTLADLGGNALQWTSIMSQWRGGSFDTVRADAFRKIAGVLQAMNTYRQERGKAVEAAFKADEQLAAMDRAIYEQKKNADSADTRSIDEHKALREAIAKRPMQTGNAYETYIHTGPLVEGTSTPESREGVTVQNTQYSDDMMSVSMLADTVAAEPVPEKKSYYTEGGPTLTEQFGQKLLDAAADPNRVLVIMPKENTVCSYGQGIGGDQFVYAEYTANSTPENPEVRILCQSRSGVHEFTRRINEIDPSDCTYAELAALHGHLVKSGADLPENGLGNAVPIGYEIGDMMSRQNFLTGLEDLSHSKMFGPSILSDAKAFLEFYAGLIEEKKQQLEEAAEFEALMNAVDNVIEGKAPKEPKEILERLSEPAKDTLEDMKSGEVISKEEWTGLLGELRDMGAISKEQFDYSRSDVKLIPLGYRDENGELVMYDGIAERFGLPRLLERAGMAESEVSASGWNGDPLDFLDAWIENLTEWREDLSRQRSETGAPKYKDFSPIEKQIEACTRVGEIVNGLLEQFE